MIELPQVVQRIKEVADETKLLVVDADGYAYYSERNLTVTSTQANVLHLKTPAKNGGGGGGAKLPRPTSLNLTEATKGTNGTSIAVSTKCTRWTRGSTRGSTESCFFFKLSRSSF